MNNFSGARLCQSPTIADKIGPFSVEKPDRGAKEGEVWRGNHEGGWTIE